MKINMHFRDECVWYPYSTKRGRRDRMVVGFTNTCAISAYHH